ncbi:MAG: capsid cement protein [Cyanobacteria bacterium P01_D01_bin.73]
MVSNHELVKAFAASGVVPEQTLVKAGAEDDFVVPATADTDIVLGVAGDLDVTDDTCDVVLSGIARVVAGGAISFGAQVTAGAGGKAVAASAGNRIAGIAMESATADGDVISIQIIVGGITA